MQEASPRLSICIPTYNQPIAVRRLLHELVSQYSSEIEIIIRDDSSNDETQNVVGEFQNVIPIHYFRGERGGLDRAIIFLTEQACGDFVWWIGDDVLFPGAIKEVLSIIAGCADLSFLWVNSANVYDLSQLAVKDVHARFFRDKNDILNIDIGLLGFITATIFKRKIAIPSLAGARQHVGSAFVCMYIVLYVISQGGQYYYLGCPYFASHPKPPGEIRWYDQIQVFGINLFKIVNEFSGDFDRRAIRRAISKNLKMVLKAIVVERAIGLKTGFAASDSKIIPMARIYWNYLDFYIFLPLMLLPTSVLRILYRAFNLIRNLRRAGV